MANPSPKNHDPSIAALRAATEARLAEVEAGILDPVVFTSRTMIETSLPHSRRAGKSIKLVNGDTTVTMYAPDGLPYGVYPRLLLMWLAREIVRRRHLPLEEARVIPLSGTLTEFMRDVGIKNPTGGERGNISLMKKQMKALFSTVIQRDLDGYAHDRNLVSLKNSLIAEDAHVWWDPQPQGQIEFGGHITVSANFYQDSLFGIVPLNSYMISQLRRSTMQMDLYKWLTYRMSYLRRPTVVTWDQLRGQFGAGYPATTRGKLDFKRKIRQAFTRVSDVWPEVTASLTDLGIMLKPGPPSVLRKDGQTIDRASAEGYAPF